MNDERRIVDVLAAHADALIGQPEALRQIDVTDEERHELASLLELAARLQQSMRPVQLPPAFARSLGRELAHGAKHLAAATKRRRRRGVLLGAATVGSLVSIASVVGAIVLVVTRARARARAAHAPMS